MPECQNEHQPGPDRHRRRTVLWTIASILAGGAVVINIAVVDAPRTGVLIPIFVAVGIALHTENRGSLCGRRHAE